MVHNRFDFPFAVHWHGLELRSEYDGVGYWSGVPGATRPPVMPGDSMAVLITPPRAGSFMYHIHGEMGHELPQGMYGAFLVLEPGEEWDRDADRVFLLSARGASIAPAPVINGVREHAPERFQPGRTYRLRFMHISADDLKRVRLLRDGEPVTWRMIAKDGADLPERLRTSVPAELSIGVGETVDYEWTPDAAGVYVLEVRTRFYPALPDPPALQRVAFGVGDVNDEALAAAAFVEPPPEEPPPIAVEPAELEKYAGEYATPAFPQFTIRFDGATLHVEAPVLPEPFLMIPIGPDLFRIEGVARVRLEFEQADGNVTALILTNPDGSQVRLSRQ
jgi:hypothetical protein